MESTAMIWGASGGIGRALVSRLVDDGWTTLAVSRHKGDVGDLTEYAIEADVSDPEAVGRAIDAARSTVEAVDLWIYTVGDIMSEKVAKIEPADWQRIMDANLTGAYLATHYSQPLLAPDAHRFYLGAVSERLRLPGLSPYATAKAGLEAFVETLRKEERKRPITIVRPAAVDTPLWEKVPMNLPASAMKPEEVADAIMNAYYEAQSGTLDLT